MHILGLNLLTGGPFNLIKRMALIFSMAIEFLKSLDIGIISSKFANQLKYTYLRHLKRLEIMTEFLIETFVQILFWFVPKPPLVSNDQYSFISTDKFSKKILKESHWLNWRRKMSKHYFSNVFLYTLYLYFFSVFRMPSIF